MSVFVTIGAIASIFALITTFSLWDENYELVRTYLKRLGYLRPDHISAKEFFDSTLSQVYTTLKKNKVHRGDSSC